MARRRFRFGDETGMTLLELLVVIVILGLLATLGSLQLSGYLGRAKSDTARLQIKELTTALDIFRMDLGRVPTPEEGLAILVTPPADPAGWRGPYLKGKALLSDPWGRPYVYQLTKTGPGYEVRSLGSDGEAGGTGDKADVSSADDS